MNWIAYATILAVIGFRVLKLRYIWVPILFLSPLLILHVISVRELLGEFRFYYGLPFAILTVLIIFNFLDRLHEVSPKPIEIVAAAALLGLTTVLFQTATSNASHKTRAMWRHVAALPAGTIPHYQALLQREMDLFPGTACVAAGAASLNLSAFSRDDIMPWNKNADGSNAPIPDHCETFLIMAKDLNRKAIKVELKAADFIRIELHDKLSIYRRLERK